MYIYIWLNILFQNGKHHKILQNDGKNKIVTQRRYGVGKRIGVVTRENLSRSVRYSNKYNMRSVKRFYFLLFGRIESSNTAPDYTDTDT